MPSRSDDYPTVYQDGAYRSTTATAVRADIEVYADYVAPNSGGSNHVAADWVMLQSTGSPVGYAQMGWWETPGNIYVFDQYTNGGVQTNFFTGDSYGSTHNYEVSINNLYSTATFYEDGTQLDFESIDFAPAAASVIGEINTRATQMPGGYDSGSQEVMDNSQIWSGAWGNLGGGPYTLEHGLDILGNSYDGSGYASIWDKACPS